MVYYTQEYDQKHLITIGSCGIGDASEYDPSILKVDFLSLHYYPDFKIWEDKNDIAIQERARLRTANDLYWFNTASPVPWIVGETGFQASQNYHIGDNLQGELGDLSNYADFSVNSSCNCGSSGFSWWSYQDVYFVDPGPYFGNNFYGLLERGFYPSALAEKTSTVDIFRNYIPQVNNICPVNYSNLYDESKLYYNKYLYPPNPNFELSSTIVDQDGLPVTDAVIGVNTDCGIDQTFNLVEDFFYTHSDQNGYFKIIPYMGSPITTPGVGVQMVTITCPGGERLRWGWNPGNITLPNIITLNRNKFSYNSVIDHLIVNGNIRDFRARNNMLVKNFAIINNGFATFKAGNTIVFDEGFQAELGSELYANIEETFADCDEYANYQMQKIFKSESFSINDSTKKNDEIQIQLRLANQSNSFAVAPNPNDGVFEISFENDDTVKQVLIYTIEGRVIHRNNYSGNRIRINLENINPGVYVLQTSSNGANSFKKIIIQ